jgi:hypothetical protein
LPVSFFLLPESRVFLIKVVREYHVKKKISSEIAQILLKKKKKCGFLNNRISFSSESFESVYATDLLATKNCSTFNNLSLHGVLPPFKNIKR